MLPQTPVIHTGIIAYNEKCKTPIATPQSGERFSVNFGLALNASGGSIAMSLGERQGNALWKAGQWDDSATPQYIDDTVDAQDAGTDDFALSTLTINDGFVVQSIDPFNLIGLQISTAAVGGTDEINYWNGTAYTTLPSTIETFTFTATGQTFLVFPIPLDWAVRGTNTEGLDVDRYPLRVRFTTAPSTAPLATEIWAVRFFAPIQSAILNNTTIQVSPNQGSVHLLSGGSLVPYFSSLSADNQAQFRYQIVR